MKSAWTRAISLILITVMVLTVVSCGSEKKTFERGKTDGKTYTNKFFGLSFEIPDSWHFASDEEIASISGAAVEMFEDPTAFEKANEGTIIDVIATNETGTYNLNITYAKGTAFTNLDASITYNNSVLMDTYKQMGYYAVFTYPMKAELSEKEFKRVTTTSSNGTDEIMKQYCYYAMQGNYLIIVTATTTDFGMSEADFRAMFK